jgi:hypothetical protein
MATLQRMTKHTTRKEQKPMKDKRHRTTLNFPEGLWKAAKIRAIELGVDAQDLVVQALAAYLKKGGAR